MPAINCSRSLTRFKSICFFLWSWKLRFCPKKVRFFFCFLVFIDAFEASGKVLKFVQAEFYFFAAWLLIVKRKANSTIEQQKCKGPRKRDWLLFLKRFLNFRFSSEIQTFLIDSVSSNWVNFIKKVEIINCSRNSKSSRKFWISFSIFFYSLMKRFPLIPLR